MAVCVSRNARPALLQAQGKLVKASERTQFYWVLCNGTSFSNFEMGYVHRGLQHEGLKVVTAARFPQIHRIRIVQITQGRKLGRDLVFAAVSVGFSSAVCAPLLSIVPGVCFHIVQLRYGDVTYCELPEHQPAGSYCSYCSCGNTPFHVFLNQNPFLENTVEHK